MLLEVGAVLAQVPGACVDAGLRLGQRPATLAAPKHRGTLRIRPRCTRAPARATLRVLRPWLAPPARRPTAARTASTGRSDSPEPGRHTRYNARRSRFALRWNHAGNTHLRRAVRQ